MGLLHDQVSARVRAHQVPRACETCASLRMQRPSLTITESEGTAVTRHPLVGCGFFESQCWGTLGSFLEASSCRHCFYVIAPQPQLRPAHRRRQPTRLGELTNPVGGDADDQGRHVAPDPYLPVVRRIGEPALRSVPCLVTCLLLAKPNAGRRFHRRPSQRRDTTQPWPLLDDPVAHHALDRAVTAPDDLRRVEKRHPLPRRDRHMSMLPTSAPITPARRNPPPTLNVLQRGRLLDMKLRHGPSSTWAMCSLTLRRA